MTTRVPNAMQIQTDLPSFSAYQSAAQAALVINTWTKIALQTKDFDQTTAFDAVTNYRFQPTVPGIYQLVGGVQFGTSATVMAGIYKNGVLWKSFNYGTGFSSAGSCFVGLNGTTDYVELWAANSANQAPVTGFASTYFQGVLLARTA